MTTPEKVLMIANNRGTNKGRLNFPGGHLELGETIEQCVRREVLEETGLTIKDVVYLGKMKFTNPDWVVNVFYSNDFSGTIRESDEGRLVWVKKTDVPYDRMWPADKIWVPIALERKQIDAVFYYDKTSTKLLKYELKTPSKERSKNKA